MTAGGEDEPDWRRDAAPPPPRGAAAAGRPSWRTLALALALGLVPAACSDGSRESVADEQAPPPWQAIIDEAQGYYDGGDHARSAALYARAAQAAADAGDERQATAFRAQQGVCLKMDGRPGEARELLLPALGAARAYGDQRTEGLALGNLARVEALDGHDELALEYLDELVAFAESIDDPRLAVQTLEQAAMLTLDMGDVDGALARLDRALERNAAAPPEEDRRDALLRQRATVLVRRRDDAGALQLWAAAEPTASSRANQALHLSTLGLHDLAALTARQAAQLFEEEGELRRRARDEALHLALSEQLRDGDAAGVERQLDEILAGGGEPAALAPFEVLAARVALTRGDPDRALQHLGRADLALEDGDPLAVATLWLSVLAQGRAGRPEAAHALLDAAPANLARGQLRGWLLLDHTRTDRQATELIPELAVDADPVGDRSLATLEALTPWALPALDWLVLHLHLADAERHRAAGRAALAETYVRDGARAALTWQLRLAQAAVRGGWASEAALAGGRARVDAWVAGELPERRGVVAVFPGDRISYELICTSDLGATTFGLPNAAELAERSAVVVEALKGGDLLAVARASQRLFSTLFGKRALVDLAGRDEWVLLLPAELTAVPPAMLVTEVPTASQPVPWLVLSHVTRLLPHVPLHGPAEEGALPTGRAGWWRIAEPKVPGDPPDPLRSALLQRYGASAAVAGRVRPGGDPQSVATGAAARASTVRRVAARTAVLELSVPGLGGGRTSGLLLSADPEAFHGDESLGLLPWHRLAELSLPPFLIVDRTRFDPNDTAHGAPYAAACALAGGARWMLINRWPQATPVREGLIGTLAQGLQLDIPFDHALAQAQRGYLQLAERQGGSAAHPLQWAAPLLYGAP